MNKIFYLLIFLIILNGCSSNDSKLWPLSKKENAKNLNEEKVNVEQIFKKEKIFTTELNPNLLFKPNKNEQYKILDQYLYNNFEKIDFNNEIKKQKNLNLKKLKTFISTSLKYLLTKKI